MLCDAALVWWYLSNGHTWWGAATVVAVLLPGALEFLSYTYYFLHGDLEGTWCQQLAEYLYWTLFSLFFPVSLVIWHIFHIAKGENHYHRYEILARARVLNSMSVLTKSALQLLLQTTIVMITWRYSSLPYHSYQLTSMVISSLILAKTCTDHHYFTASGKNVNVNVPYCEMITRIFFNLLHILLRGFILALLASYLHFFSLLLLFLMIVANLIVAPFVLKTSWNKHIMTAFSAIILPNCFMAR
jgi:hypothetical protein